MGILRLILAFQRVLLGSRAALAAENLALRHQLGVLQRSVKRPRLRSPEDRLGATPAGPCRGRVHGRQVHGPPAEACRWNATRRFRGSSVRPDRRGGCQGVSGRPAPLLHRSSVTGKHGFLSLSSSAEHCAFRRIRPALGRPAARRCSGPDLGNTAKPLSHTSCPATIRPDGLPGKDTVNLIRPLTFDLRIWF